jgi:hypothetical protein
MKLASDVQTTSLLVNWEKFQMLIDEEAAVSGKC